MRNSTAARTLISWSLLLAPLACNSAPSSPAATPAYASQTARTADPNFHIDLKETVGYLASDELEGRGIDTAGINKAADYVADAFDKFGLVPMGDNGTYFQSFKTTTSVKLGPATALSARLPDDGEPKRYDLKQGFMPVQSADGAFDGDVVVAGYGISNPHAGYDDYDGLDVKGKVVLILRYEPHDEKGNSRFSKTPREEEKGGPHAGGTPAGGENPWSEFATLESKLKTAADRGAAAVVFANPPTFHRGDLLMAAPFTNAIAGSKSGIPMVQVTQGVADQWLKAAGAKVDLKGLQSAIDETGKPVKVELGRPVRVTGKVEIQREQRDVKNVVALLPGTDASAEREYVVVGAHYDHLGFGGPGSFEKRIGKGEIHNGADDNASGTTAMLKVAEHYADAKDRPRRSILFAAFTAEESGLIGSRHLVDHPPVPLDKVAAMLNLDMVGRVTKDELSIGGFGTAPSFERFMKEADEASPLALKSLGKSGYGPSDHLSFASKKVPVLFFFSGIHRDYHRPTDDADKINYDGLAKVVDLAVDMTGRLLAMPKEQYVDAADAGGMTQMGSASGSMRATLGIIPVYGGDENVKGCEIDGATPGSPAAAAGLKDGDVITKWNDAEIGNLIDLTEALRKGKPGDKVKLKVKRGTETVDLEATLAERKG